MMTGTLTDGTPRVTTIHALPEGGFTGDEMLAFSAAAERASEHPLAAAIVTAAYERRLVLSPAEHFTSTPGRGVTAQVNGHLVQVGSPAILTTANATTESVEAEGLTAVLVVVDGVPAGVLALTDHVRSGARDTVTALAGLTGHTPVLLTGDNIGAAHRLAEDVGITEVHAGLLPADKVTHVHALQDGGQRVLLVGDGVNDAPAMAAAHLGVAMGRHGSDLALETSDAVIVRDDLTALPTVIALSRRARRVVTANLAIAATVITGLVLSDLFGHLPLPLGVAGHEGSTVIVGLNGLRLLRKNAWCQP